MIAEHWQPISTAAKDRRVLMLWPDGEIRIGSRWCDGDTGLKCELDFGDFNATVYVQKDYLPTHWAPLPTQFISADEPGYDPTNMSVGGQP